MNGLAWAGVLFLCLSPACFADSSGDIAVNEIRVRDRTGNGVRSRVYEVTRERKELLIDDTDANGVLASKFKCPRFHKVVAKPIAGRFTDSPHTKCAPKVVLEVWNVDKYPERSVRIIVPFAPGGVTDLIARSLAQELEELWKQQVTVENRGGSSGNIGTAAVADAMPDGYTLLMGVSQNFTIYPALFSKLPYDPQFDFSPVTLVAAIPNILVTSPSSGTNSVKDLVDKAKANPGKLNFASLGFGSESHLSAAQFAAATGTSVQHVPYTSSASAMSSLLSGQAQFAFNPSAFVLPNIKSGQVKALAIVGPRRISALPDVPTMAEIGIPGYQASTWTGLFAPTGTPQQLVGKIQNQVATAVKQRKLVENLVDRGIEPVANTPAEFASRITRDATQWASVIKAAGVKPQ